MMRARRAISAGKSRTSIPRKLVRGISVRRSASSRRRLISASIARDPAEARNLDTAREQFTIHVGKRFGPTGYLGTRPILNLGVHRAEQFANHLMGVG